MMPKLLWGDIVAGDHVELNGRDWLVTKAKAKGKRVKVTVTSGTHTATSEVRARDAVTKIKPPKLHDAAGRQTRWATERERKASEPKHRTSLEPGDASITEPPAVYNVEKAAKGEDPWATGQDRIEKKLDAILGAHLVGEATDESKGYYVPPVDVSTIASHLSIFHPNIYDAEKDEATMIAGHAHEHKQALEGTTRLDINHWHTKTRPAQS